MFEKRIPTFILIFVTWLRVFLARVFLHHQEKRKKQKKEIVSAKKTVY